jgi:hypothetical protein
MCSLCGSLINNNHWSVRRKNASSRKAERRAQIHFINQILKHYGARIRQLGNYGYLLTGSNRSSQLIEDLTKLWLEIEKIPGVKCDPLDPKLIEMMSIE